MSDTVKSISELKTEWLKQESVIKKAKSVMEGIELILLAHFGEEKKKKLNAIGKEAGSMTFEHNGIKLNFEISKRVEWDSNKLSQIGATLPPEIASKLFKVKVTMPEKMFDGLTDAELIRKVREARTVKYGNPAVSFVTL